LPQTSRNILRHRQLRTTAATPVGTLLANPGLEIKATAEIQDLYSLPIQTIEVASRGVPTHEISDIALAGLADPLPVALALSSRRTATLSRPLE
jgi:hypothetical protein